MQIVERNGDIFTTEQGIIVHACNDSGVMGAGIAKIVKERYSLAFEKYYKFIKDCKAKEKSPMGYCVLVPVYNDEFPQREIANLISGTLKSGIDYKAFEKSMKDLVKKLKDRSNYTLSFPDLIGAGLFGGDRETIHNIIETVFKDKDCVIEYWIYNK